jgi:ketosteroid isomerase-like protein
MTAMLEKAPEVIGRFIDAAAERDFDAIGQCFTEDATVEDEERTQRGRTEISAWQRKTRTQYDYTVTVTSGQPDGENAYRVGAHLRGTFPGGEADVEYRFVIRDGLISSLRIS